MGTFDKSPLIRMPASPGAQVTLGELLTRARPSRCCHAIFACIREFAGGESGNSSRTVVPTVLTQVYLICTIVCTAIAIRFGGAGVVLAMGVPLRVHGIAPAEIVAPVALAVELIRMRGTSGQVLRPAKRATPSTIQLLCLMLAILLGLGFFWSRSPDDSFGEYRVWAATLTIAFTTYLYGRRTGDRGLGAWLVSGIVLVATGIAWKAFGFPPAWAVLTSFVEDDVFGGGVFTRGGHPFIGRSTYYASFAVVTLLLAISVRPWPFLRLSAVALSVIALAQTQSFGAVFGAAAGLAVVVLLRARGRLTRFAWLTFILAVAWLATTSFETSRSMDALDGNGRRMIYGAALNAIEDLPLLGHGPGAWRSIPLLEDGTHSLPLTVAVEIGLVGLLLATLLFAAAMLRFWRLPLGSVRTAGLACTVGMTVNTLVQASAEGVSFREFGLSLIAFLMAAGYRERTQGGAAHQDPQSMSSRDRRNHDYRSIPIEA